MAPTGDVQREPSGPAAPTRHLTQLASPGGGSELRQSLVTYIDVFQIQEVQGQPVAPPDDGWPQVSTDGAGQHRAESHGHCGHTDLLLGGEAELHHLCRERRCCQLQAPGGEVSTRKDVDEGIYCTSGAQGTSGIRSIICSGLAKQTDGHNSWERGHDLCQKLQGLCESHQVRNHSQRRGSVWAVDL